MSSPSRLIKLLRRVSCGAPTRLPNMLTPLPNDSGETFDILPLNGELGLPNSCKGCTVLPRTEDGAGIAVMLTCAAFFDGVSGMWELAKSVGGIGTSRLRLEMRPVE